MLGCGLSGCASDTAAAPDEIADTPLARYHQTTKKRVRNQRFRTRFVLETTYIVTKQKRSANSTAMTVTGMSFFVYLPVHRVISV